MRATVTGTPPGRERWAKKRIEHCIALPLEHGCALSGRRHGICPGGFGFRFLQRQDDQPDRRISARRRLRHLCADLGAPLWALHPRPAAGRGLQHARRGLADRREPDLQQGRPRRFVARHVRIVGGDGAAARQQSRAVRRHQVQLDREHVERRRLLRRVAEPGHRCDLRRDAHQRDDLGRRRGGGDHIPASHGAQERAARKNQSHLRLCRHARHQSRHAARRGERHLRLVRLLDQVAVCR